MKKTKNVISLLLLASMLSAVACGGTEAPGGTDVGTTSAGETTAEVDTTARDSLPDNLDFDGAEITMLVRGNLSMPEFFVEEQSGDIVDDALYNRNAAVSDRLNVKLDFVEEPGAYGEKETFAQKLTNSILAGDRAYDVVAGYSMAIANLAADGMLYDLNETAYLDFSKPWWSDSLQKESTVNGKLFFASGDISTNLLYYMYATFFNKTMMSEYDLESPYELVLDGKWTLDKLIEMTTDVYSDLNGDGKKDYDDRFGMVVADVYIDPFFFGSGLKTTELDKDGVPQISPLFSSEKTQDLIDKLCTFLHTSNDAIIAKGGEERFFYFDQGRFMFSNNEILFAVTNLRNKDFEYGILPVPKWDEAQDEYYTIASFPYSLYGIPIDVEDPDMVSAVLEALASESYRTVSPALFEVALKVKYSSDDYASKMYDILRETMTYDFGRVFTDSLNSLTFSMFRDSVASDNTNWASTYAANSATLENKLNQLLEGFE